MAEGDPPQTADNAVRGFILLFVLGAVLHGFDVMGPDGIWYASVWWVVAGVLAIFDWNWVRFKTWFGSGFSETANKVATDFRWWVITALVLFLGISFSRSLPLVFTPPYTAMPTRHYLTTGQANDSDFDGRPLGFWWDASNLNINRAPGPEPILSVSHFYIRGKNLGSEEVPLDSAYLVSGIDSSTIPMKIDAVPSGPLLGGPIDVGEAAPIPVGAEFTLSARFGSDERALPEAEFMKSWDNFYVVIKAGDEKIRRLISKSYVRSWFDRNHPELLPHITRRR
jgi:hypothetical protein